MSKDKTAPFIKTTRSEAGERAQKAGYALILMDVQMPILDGLEAAPGSAC